MTDVAPIRRFVNVKASADHAFALFTSHIGSWWPLASHSVYGDSGVVAFEGDLLVERSADGTSVWAEVVEWDPPRKVRLAWHAGQPADRATDLSISFIDDGGTTLVMLEHSGWERAADPEASARNYGAGWPLVLDRYCNQVAILEPPEPADETGADDLPAPDSWYALVHTPGPIVVDGGSVFAHPLFAEHVAFLNRLAERGLLVAAGPMSVSDQVRAGTGMTVVRVGAEARDVDIVDLATRDDLSVAGGLLEVSVQPWDVRFS